MNNKILVKIYVPKYGKKYDFLIPVSEQIWKVSKLAIKCIGDSIGIKVNLKSDFILINENTNEIYNPNVIVKNTNIRNASELILLEVKKQIVNIS